MCRQLAHYLEQNFDARVDTVTVTPWLDLLDAVESASVAWRMIAILSPESVPERGARERWDVRYPNLAWALAADCPYPKILRRQRFFDLSADPLPGFRALRAWLVGDTFHAAAADAPSAFADFVDTPGAVSLADPAAVEAARPYFESTFELDARARSITSLTAELGAMLGFDRSLDYESLRDSTLTDCRHHRRLLVFHGSDPDVLGELGRSSAVGLPAPDPVILTPAQLISAIRESKTGRTAPPSAADLDRGLIAAFATADWATTRDLGRAAFGHLRDEYRLAESYDLLESLKRAATFYGDPDVIDECASHQSWIGERWSSEAVAEVLEGAVQLRFAW